ncbi:MAG: hypothetical protein IT372_37190 [Polyangiaceae bacterium]|nr:hypothetical protein [Polyangiaceae bacterium]
MRALRNLPPARPLLLALALAAAGCSEGLTNAPSINRQWTQEDFQHDVISNGPESCPKEGAKDPLAPPGEIRSNCPEAADGPAKKAPPSPKP